MMTSYNFIPLSIELLSRRDVGVERVRHKCGWCLTTMYVYTARECREKNNRVLVVDVIGRYAFCNCNKRCLPFYARVVCTMSSLIVCYVFRQHP